MSKFNTFFDNSFSSLDDQNLNEATAPKAPDYPSYPEYPEYPEYPKYPERPKGRLFTDKIEELQPIIENKEFNHLPYVRNRLQLKFTERGELAKAITVTTDNSFLSKILLKEESNVYIPDGVKFSKNLKNEINFSIDDVDKLLGITIGRILIYAINDEKDIKYFVNNHLNWIYKNDVFAHKKHYLHYYNGFRNIYTKYKPKNELEKLFQVIEIIVSEYILFYSKVLAYIFKELAKLLRKLKIENKNYWNPVLENGYTYNQKYAPIFIPLAAIGTSAKDNAIDFKKLKEYFLNIDIVISKSFKLNKTDNHTQGTSYYKYLLQGVHSPLRQLASLIYDTLEDLSMLETMLEHTKILNAFLVGIHNGLIEMLAGVLDLTGMIAELLQSKKRVVLIKDLNSFIEKVEEKGLFSIINEIIKAFISKYKDTSNVYDIAKFIGEDIAEILLDVILAILTGGATLIVVVKKFEKLLSLIKKLDPEDLIKYLNKTKVGNKTKRKIKEVDLLPKSFHFLDAAQQLAYTNQKRFIADIKSKNDFKPGKRSNGDTRKNTNTTTGNWGEMRTDQFVLNLKHRWKPLHEMVSNWQKNYGKGIDHIFENLDFKPPMPPPPKYIIGESKAFDGKLNTLVNGTPQMSRKWIENRIEAIVKRDKGLSNKERRRIIRNIKDNYEPVLFEIKDVGKKPIMTLLDSNAKRIKGGIDNQKLI